MVTIDRVEVLAVAPDVRTFRYTDHEPAVTTTTTVVRVIDADGAEGVGAYDSDTFGEPDRAPLERLRSIVPRLIGRDADDPVAIASMLTERGNLPFPPAVTSAVEIALWDLGARRAGLPLVAFLGVDDPAPLPAYASVELFDTTEGYLESLEQLTARGFTAAKIHAWGDPGRDVALLERLRGSFPDLVLMHDAEGRYDRAGARRVTEAGAAIGLRWLEAPLPDLDLEGYRSLALVEVARDLDLPVEPIAYGHALIQAANLHVMLAVGRTAFVELPVPAEPWEHGVTTTIRIDDAGLVHVPDGPGLGIEVDGDAMRAAAVASLR